MTFQTLVQLPFSLLGFWSRPLQVTSLRRCSCIQWCFEKHLRPVNSEVWTFLFILSCLSALFPAAHGHQRQALKDLQHALKKTETILKSSDALLYTPNSAEVTMCTSKFFYCYLLEFYVLLNEMKEENKAEFMHPLKMVDKTLKDYQYNGHDCLETHPCEAQRLRNSSVFLQSMMSHLTRLLELCDNNTSTCV